MSTNIDSQLSFPYIVGQGKAQKLFGRSLSSERLAHAYLFKGPDGVGKKLFARGVAAVINCIQKRSGSACGHCPSCLKHMSGNHPDFHFVCPEKGAIKIDQIRQLKRILSYPPYEAKTRVVLLEDIHTMRQEAANSLLKILEEPPKDNLLLLTAEASKNILQTIASRCQSIPFYNLSVEATQKILLDKEEGLDTKTARILARLSEGSPGRALLLMKTDMIAIWEEVTGLIAKCPGGEDVDKVLKVAESMAELKENLTPLLGLLRVWLRDMLVAMSGGLKIDGDEHAKGAAFAKDWSSQELFAKMKALDRAELELGHNCNRTLVCEILLFRLL